MKINESTLVAFATSKDVPIIKEGWLWKKGEVNPRFQKRWFILKGNLLFYFENKASKEPYGVIILEGCMIDLAEEDQERFGFKISWKGDRTRVYHFGTEFQQTLVEWMKLLARASHDYMKLQVYELEQKLIELESIETKRKTKHQQTPIGVSNVLPPPNGHHSLSTVSGKLLPGSQSAEPLSQCIEPTAAPYLNQQSQSSHSLTTTSSSLAGAENIRENPFNDGPAAAAATSSAVLDGPGARTRWTQYHANMGQKILRDQTRWLQQYTARNPLVEIT